MSHSAEAQLSKPESEPENKQSERTTNDTNGNGHATGEGVSVNVVGAAVGGGGVKELVWYGATEANAPNPLRVRIFLNECGLEIGEIKLNLAAAEMWSPAHRARNRHGQVPTLQITLADGTIKYLSESISICRFIDAIYQPAADLFSLRTGNPLDSALVDSMIRQLEFRLVMPLRYYWQHFHPFTAKVMAHQYKDFGESCVGTFNKECAWVNDELSKHSFIVGEKYTIADIILYGILHFAKYIGLQKSIPSEYPHIQQFVDKIEARPTTKAPGKVLPNPNASAANANITFPITTTPAETK